MTLQIELTPEEALRIESARKQGINIHELMHDLIVSLPDSEKPAVVEDKTLELLAQWDEEDATDDEAELRRRDNETEELVKNLNANRMTLPIPKV